MDKYLKRAKPTNSLDLEIEPKRKRERSIVWDHFKKSSDKAHGICNYCCKWLKTGGNTTNLLEHLKRTHQSCVSTEKGEMPKTISTFLNKEPFYDNDSTIKKRLDQKVMNMIAKDVRPFSCVHDEGFVELLREAVPRYKLPSQAYFRDVMLPREYDRLQLKVRSVLDKVKYVSLTTDLWTSAANDGYITITCHFVTDKFKLNSAVLSTAPLITATNHDAQNIADSISEVLAKWQLLSKVVTVTTDNDSTMKKACEILKFKHLPCLAHTINLLVQDILRLEVVHIILSKCKGIVTYFKQSQIAAAKLKEAQNTQEPLTLIQEVATRWNSAYEMIKRMLKLNEYVTLTLKKLRNAPAPISAEELKVLNELTELLSPFQEATLLVSTSKNVSVSLIIPVVNEIHHKINQFNASTQEGKIIHDYIKQLIVDKLDNFETQTIPSIGTLIDPRFKKDAFIKTTNADLATKALEQELVSAMSTNPRRQPTPTTEQRPSKFTFLKSKTFNKVQSTRVDAIMALRQHLEKENFFENGDPLKYWEMSTDDSSLKLVATKYLCIQASSCEAERVFSKAIQIVCDRRTRLSPEAVDKLLFLNKNWNFNNTTDTETTDLE